MERIKCQRLLYPATVHWKTNEEIRDDSVGKMPGVQTWAPESEPQNHLKHPAGQHMGTCTHSPAEEEWAHWPASLDETVSLFSFAEFSVSNTKGEGQVTNSGDCSLRLIKQGGTGDPKGKHLNTENVTCQKATKEQHEGKFRAMYVIH